MYNFISCKTYVFSLPNDVPWIKADLAKFKFLHRCKCSGWHVYMSIETLWSVHWTLYYEQTTVYSIYSIQYSIYTIESLDVNCTLNKVYDEQCTMYPLHWVQCMENSIQLRIGDNKMGKSALCLGLLELLGWQHFVMLSMHLDRGEFAIRDKVCETMI